MHCRGAQALQVPWIPYILQPPRRLWHQVPHRSSHQSVWSTNQILVQPACWHLQQISHFLSHSNELTLVGMRSMVTTEIATDETWSLHHSKYLSHPKNIYVPSQERKNNEWSSQKTIIWHTMCREYDRSTATIIHWESCTNPYPLRPTKLMLTTCCNNNNNRKRGQPYTTNKDTIVNCLVLQVAIDQNQGSMIDWVKEVNNEKYWKSLV